MRLVFVFIFVFTFIFSSFAQREKYSYYFHDYRKKSLTIPFQFVNNVIIMPLSINGSDSLKFILDTGVKTPIITKLPKKDSAKFQYIQVKNIFGLGEGKPLEAYYSPDNNFNINGLKRKHINTLVLDEDYFHLSEELGVEINGLIGYDLFKDIIVEVNYYQKKLTFHDPKYFKARKNKKAITLPLKIIQSKPYISSEITMEDGTTIDANLLIDTGASLALWLSKETHEDIKLPKKTISTFIGKGLNGDIHGEKGKIQSIKIGKYKLKNPVTSFPDSAAVLKTILQEGRNGSIGQEILRRFTIYFNYQDSLITFIPNHHYNEVFKYNLSGLSLTNVYPGLPIYVVSKIREDSPADLAGLQVNDQLTYINRLNCSQLTLSEINYILQCRSGKKIYLKAKRNGEELKFVFKLKDEL
jgi:predicted aspartyl protease